MRLSSALVVIYFILRALVSHAQIEPLHLSKETEQRIERVPEFKFIKEEANKLGVKVYLFGGTASAFAHYVRWDLERETGDEKYQAERFDYDFTNIYRGNQDLDIVVDGTAEQAAVLRRVLKKEYPHFVGSKEAWEVRLLNAQVGDKLPLLDNPDFLNQHTDTNSTGMIAVNADPGEIIFRDLFSWEDPDSRFLNDVASGRIKFLFSESHETTSRFKDGKNPPVFAAIRYLAKLAQYEVEGSEDDLEIIKSIIEGTNWRKVRGNSYVRYKLEEFGKKVLLNAPDSEYAWNLLEETGLRESLVEIDGNQIGLTGSLSWWMNKEPLRTKPLGEGNGKTAAEIFKSHINEDGEIVVAHETNSFEAYENITRSSRGAANAFISRRGVSGEAAVHGDGFYTRLGTIGARATNLTIRFKLNPNAREGEDFIYSGDYIVIRNKAALELIQENLNVSLVDFMNLLKLNQVFDNDHGLLEKLKRKFSRLNQDSEEFKDAKEYILELVAPGEALPESLRFNLEKYDTSTYDKLIDVFTDEIPKFYRHSIDKLFENKEVWRGRTDWIELVLRNNIPELTLKLIEDVLTDEYWVNEPKVIESILSLDTGVEAVIEHVLSKSYWGVHSHIIDDLVEKGKYDNVLVKHIIHLPFWDRSKAEQWIHTILLRGNEDYSIIENVLSKPEWINQEEWVNYIFEKGDSRWRGLIINVLSKKEWANDKGLSMMHKMIDTKKVDSLIISRIVNSPYWSKYPELLKRLSMRNFNSSSLVEYEVFLKPQWKGQVKLLEQVLFEVENQQDLESLINTFLLKGQYSHRVDLLFKALGRFHLKLEDLEQYNLSLEKWNQHEMFLRSLVRKKEYATLLVEFVFSQTDDNGDGKFSNRPDIIFDLIQIGHVDKEIVKHLLSKPEWRKHTYLVDALLSKGDVDVDVDLVEHVLSKWDEDPSYIGKLVTKNTFMGYMLKTPGNVEMRGRLDKAIARYVLSNPEKLNIKWLEIIIDRGYANSEVIKFVYQNEYLVKYPDLLQKLIKKIARSDYADLIKVVFTNPKWSKYLNFLKPIVLSSSMGSISAKKMIIKSILSQDYASEYSNLVHALVVQGSVWGSDWSYDEELVEFVLSRPHFITNSKWISIILKRNDAHYSLARHIFSKPESEVHISLMRKIINKHINVGSAFYNFYVINSLPNGHWAKYPDLVRGVLEDKTKHNLVAEHVLKGTAWSDHPDLLEAIIEGGQAGSKVIEVFEFTAWKRYPGLFIKFLKNYPLEGTSQVKGLLVHKAWKDIFQSYLGNQKLTIRNLVAQSRAVPFNDWYAGYKRTEYSCKALLAP